ncbi:hypothetical protein CAAN1_15S00474 [[Candida] anglica]|uniref:RNB domain-containing protein n=1 Tax=[Candida] anglica TaxID=148631 RepID=A0ABP0E818_9ASCO
MLSRRSYSVLRAIAWKRNITHYCPVRSDLVSEIRNVRDDYRRRTEGEIDLNEDNKSTSMGEQVEDPVQTISKIVSKKASINAFVDPGNREMDLSKSNEVIYNTLCDANQERKRKRIVIPQDRWMEKYVETRSVGIKDKNGNNQRATHKSVRTAMERAFANATISSASAHSSIAVGDLVALFNDSTFLYIVVETPKKLGSNHYMYINHLGEIVFGPKDMIKLRFPQAIPTTLGDVLSNLVQIETKWKDVAPIGYPDAEFSRSDFARPIDRINTPEVEVDGEEVVVKKTDSDVGDDLILANASSQLLTNSDVLTYQVTANAREVYNGPLINVSLKTTEELPGMVRKLEFLHRVLQYNERGDMIDSPVTISIFEMLDYIKMIDFKQVTEYLEGRRNIYDLHSVSREAIMKKESEIYANPEMFLYRDVRRYLYMCGSGGKHQSVVDEVIPTLGKAIPKVAAKESAHAITTFLAAILGLRQQSRLWNLNQRTSYYPPLSVTVLPLRSVGMRNDLINTLKETDEGKKFARYVIGCFNRENMKKPRYYDETVQLMKDFVAGNFTNDPQADSVMVSLIREVERLARTFKISLNSGPDPSFEYSKVRCYEILQILREPFRQGTSGWENPIKWSYSLQLPNNGVSSHSDQGEIYYNYLDTILSGQEEQIEKRSSLKDNSSEISIPKEITPILDSFDKPLVSDSGLNVPSDLYETDPLEEIREDFNEIPVYCIDSESAHEIDDGISIEEKDGEYRISVFVANPTSYIKPTSSLANIAFGRGSTTYLPEGPTMMLPGFMSKLAGLGDSTRTRTFVVRYQVEIAHIEEYLKSQNASDVDNRQAEKVILQKIQDSITKSANVTVGYASNFPQGFTYGKVNEILNDQENIKSFANGSPLGDIHATNLFKLSKVSTVLKDIRILIGDGLVIEGKNFGVNVNYVSKVNQEFKSNKGAYEIALKGEEKIFPLIKIEPNINQSSDSKSQLLVSECMISANYAASQFARINKIPVIYRSQNMNLDKQLRQEIDTIVKERHFNNESLNLEDMSNILPFLTAAKLSTKPEIHQSLGVKGYTTVTSPLRRYADMINHWMFEDYLLERKNIENGSNTITSRIDPSLLNYIGGHLQSCELVNKQVQRFSNSFWAGVFLKQYTKLVSNGKVEPIPFKVLVQSRPKLGMIRVQMIDFPDLKTHISVNSTLTEYYKEDQIPEVGSVLEGVFDFVKLDYIENEVVIEFQGVA